MDDYMKFVEFDHKGGCHEKRVYKLTKIVLHSHLINDDDYRINLTRDLQSIGWEDEERIDEKSRIKISSTFSQVGLVIWFGNMHSIHEYIMAMELLFKRKKINSGIIITATKKEAIRRFNRNKKEKTNSTGNYSEFSTLKSHIESLQEIINVPISVIGIEK